jgi:hypothetical protein
MVRPAASPTPAVSCLRLVTRTRAHYYVMSASACPGLGAAGGDERGDALQPSDEEQAESVKGCLGREQCQALYIAVPQPLCIQCKRRQHSSQNEENNSISQANLTCIQAQGHFTGTPVVLYRIR